MSYRDELLAQMSMARGKLESVVEALHGREDVDLGDGWRVRDILAHIALWERVATWKLDGSTVPNAEGLIDQEPWDLNGFNEEMRERWRPRPISAVRAELSLAHEVLVAAVALAPEEECAVGGRVWTVIDEDGAGHYEQHVMALQAAV
ncbi:MAG TPA: maleylpyruvate isomerase N-terminal domain-containing protein [Nitrolancea sp.]|nr:maleylpyruvate isomerase N-terminal domain-containing protein [Nitrolancea sp.]